MSIRITKQIGYYVKKKNLKNFLVPNFTQIFEDFDYSDNFDQIFKEKIQSLTKEYNNKMDIHYLNSYLNSPEHKFEAINLIQQIYNYDSFDGVLFTTPELLLTKRHDDTIDYYETNSMTFKVDWLDRPIYPISGYIYTGETPQPKITDWLNKYNQSTNKPTLSIGDVVDNQLLQSAIFIQYSTTGKTPNDYFKLIKKTKCFKPNIDFIAFLIAKASGILQDDVDYFKFSQIVHPAIITTWG